MKQPTLTSTDARREFRNRVTTWAGRINVEPMQIQVRRMSRKWASCSSRRCVCFAETLLEQPIAFQEYVIVHELLHLRVPNHGKLFKSLLSAYLPQWKDTVCNGCNNRLRSIGVNVQDMQRYSELITK